jgi:hypothetical protein
MQFGNFALKRMGENAEPFGTAPAKNVATVAVMFVFHFSLKNWVAPGSNNG